MNKLWDKGIALKPEIEEFTVGKDKDLDLILAKWDIIGSMAHAVMLKETGLISKNELYLLLSELEYLYNKAKENKLVFQKGIEDIHSLIETELTEALGKTGMKIHTGRSRNDQVLLDLRLYYRSEIASIASLVSELAEILLLRAKEHAKTFMPGYTHMQIAMVSSVGLWFSAWAESLENDLKLLLLAFNLNNFNPLGSAAGYGTNLPVDREITSRILQFEGLNISSVYAQISRVKNDITLANSIASVSFTLSKLCSDLILFSGQNFSFFSLPENYCTGSSIMPQKKNPDIIEIIRSKCNQLQSLPATIMLMQNNLNSGYCRDMQLLKEQVLPAIKTLKECLYFTIKTIASIIINKDLQNDQRYQPLFLTDQVNKLVLKGVPFREAYKTIAGNPDNNDQLSPVWKDYTHIGSPGNPGADILRPRIDTLREYFKTPSSDSLIEGILSDYPKET